MTALDDSLDNLECGNLDVETALRFVAHRAWIAGRGRATARSRASESVSEPRAASLGQPLEIERIGQGSDGRSCRASTLSDGSPSLGSHPSAWQRQVASQHHPSFGPERVFQTPTGRNTPRWTRHRAPAPVETTGRSVGGTPSRSSCDTGGVGPGSPPYSSARKALPTPSAAAAWFSGESSRS
jgi:hypothetical protein